MYINEKDQLLDLINTIEKMTFLLHKSGSKLEILNDMNKCLDLIKKFLSHINFKNDNICNILNELIGNINCMVGQNQFNDNSYYKKIRKKIIKLETEMFNYNDIRYKALFLPYKASMWTSLESIWEAAKADPRCEAIVMPIPYFDLDNNGEKIKLNYEGDLYPENVPILDYRIYDIKALHPEMIFIHNPYDAMNNITRVPEIYYSNNLKANTKCLVYSPYFTFGRYYSGKGEFQFNTLGAMNSDKIIVQSKRVKDLFLQHNFSDNKILPVGSPKIDSLVKKSNLYLEIPDEWKVKTKNRKVFLLNTHLFYFSKSKDLGITCHTEILNVFLRRKDCALIWRPHPLMRTFYSYKDEKYYNFIKNFEEKILSSDNCMIDDTADYMTAFNCSDALISTYSSLVNEYMVTGKPVLIFQKKPDEESALKFPINYSYNYYRFSPENVGYEKFINMVISNEDPKYEDRMAMLNEVFENIDGQAGKKAYDEILKWIL